MSSRPIVDVDHPETWPAEVHDVVDRLVEAAPDESFGFQDLTYHVDFAGCDQWLRKGLAGCGLRVLHATRLLEHEEEDIRASGLRVLSEQLVRDRQDRIRDLGYIGTSEHAALRESSLFNSPRRGVLDLSERVCFATNRYALRSHQLNSQLVNWGGEVQYNTGAWDEIDSSRVKGLGRPSIVVALIDGSDPGLAHVSAPDLVVAFVGVRLGLDGAGVTIHYCDNVPGKQIEAIWHPGDPEYDVLGLPFN